MKKFITLTTLLFSVLFLTDCSSSRKAAKIEVPKLNYESNLATVILNNCSPCHIPAKGGFKKPYDNYLNVKTDIDSIIRRIELNPTDKGFMPFKKTAKLNDSIILVFKQWKADGLLEK